MPCVADQACVVPSDVNNQYADSNFNPDGFTHFAHMGWVGYVQLTLPKLGNAQSILRANSCDINLKQAIEMPDVVDGRIDKTVYKLGPKIVEGSLSMPVVADMDPEDASVPGCPTDTDLRNVNTGAASSLLTNVWCWATSRSASGRLAYDDARLDVRYANHAAYKFDRALVNTLSMNVAKEDQITFDINMICRTRARSNETFAANGSISNPDPLLARYLSPARVLTWNDISITGVGGCGNPDLLFSSNQVREFSMEINNNANRFYGLNGSLFPVDINVGKREISGSLTLLGLADRLSTMAQDNAKRFTEKNQLRMALYIGEDSFNTTTQTFGSRDWTGTNPPGLPIFAKKLVGVVFEIEEMKLTNEVFETTVKYHAMASDQDHFEAFTPSGSCAFPAWEA